MTVSKELSHILQTEVKIGHINLGLLNRVIVDNLLLKDQSKNDLLRVARLSAKFDISSFFKGQISISSVQLFGFSANLKKATPNSASNFKFIIDALASKDTLNQEKSALDLRINSILIRRGKIAYDLASEKETPGRFNPHHIKVQNIIGNLSLKALRKDSINVSVKRLSFDEQSGFSLKKFSIKLVGNGKATRIENFKIELPETAIALDRLQLNYKNTHAFDKPLDKVHVSLRIAPSSYITLKDISPFIPALSHFKEPLWIDLQAQGTVNQFSCSRLSIFSKEKDFSLSTEASFQNLTIPQETYLFGKVSELNANKNGIAFLVRNLSSPYNGVPPILDRLGNLSFRGEISGYFTDLVTYGIFRTDLGNVQTDLKLTSDKTNHRLAYSGAIKTEEFQLGSLIHDNKIDKTSLNIEVNGQYVNNQMYSTVLKGLIKSFEYNHYTYENITLDGEYKKKAFNGRIALNDPNGTALIDGNIDFSTQVPVFNFSAELDNIRPNELHLTSKYKEAMFGLNLKANFSGKSIDDMIGEIRIDSMAFKAPGKEYFMKNFKIHADKKEGGKRLTVNSDFMTATLEGDIKYETLPASVIRMVQTYLPSVINAPVLTNKKNTNNIFKFNVHLYNTDFFNTVFDFPLTVYSHSVINGYFNDNTKRCRVEGYFPQIEYDGNFIESGMFVCDNPADYLQAKIRFTNLKKKDAITYALAVQAQNDQLSTTFNWGNNAAVTYSGKLDATTRFFKTIGNQSPLKAVVQIHKTDIILNDSLWNIHPSEVVIDSGKVDIKNFFFNNKERYVRINGLLSPNPADTVKVDLRNINIKYVFDMVNISDDVNFSGDATGTAYASGLLKKASLQTRLFVKDFSLNNGRFGDLQVYGLWDNDKRGISLNGHISTTDSQPSQVSGYIYPLKPESGLDLKIDAQKLNLKFLEHYLGSIATDIRGHGTGKVHFYGSFKKLNLDGHVMTDASLKFDILNTRFAIKDTIKLSPSGLDFDNIKIADMENHRGTLNGFLKYEHFKNMRYSFEVQSENMLVMNTKESSDLPFYGTIYGTGNAVLSGDAVQGLNVNVAMSTNRNSVFTYINSSTASATNNQFIKFVDKTPKRLLQDSVFQTPYNRFRKESENQGEKAEESTADIRLNIIVDATPDATIRIIMDPIAGDYISAKGYGNIRTEFYNKGDAKMFGTYQINQGIYKFSLQEVIRKDFQIRDGSAITFNGSPLEANLNIHAAHTVNSVSLNDLISTEDAAYALIKQPNVKVDCIMDLTGIMLRPTIKLGIELPHERDEIQTLVRSNIEEQMNLQVLYLLSIGKFYTDNRTNKTQNSNVMPSVISSTLSGQLNNALSQVLQSNNWNFGTNFSTGDRGWTDMEVEGILSAQLLNNRLLINGNFGYRDNPMTNTNFVGDFEAEWLLNRSGEIRLKAYNKTNDRYYIKTNLTTQGVGIIYKKDFNRWSDLFFWKSWSIRNKRQKEKK